MDIKEKLKMLRKLSEVDLTKNFLIPLYESDGMGCKSVRYTHRRLEFGKDVIYYKEDEYGNRLFTGVQVKKSQIRTGNIDNIMRQVSEAFGEPFTDLGTGKKENLDRVVVLTSCEFLEEAKDSFWASLKGNSLDRFVTCIDGNQLVRLLDKHMPSAFWDDYDYFNKYFNSMKKEFKTIKDISALGQKEYISLEEIYVSLRVSEEVGEGEMTEDEEEEWKIFEERSVRGEEKEERMRSEERIKVVDAERAVSLYDKLLIVGAPGSGKTTLFKYLALKVCRENLERQERTYVPIPINMRELSDSGKSIRGYVDKVFEKYGFPKSKKFVEKELKEGRCWLLLDGFDELATKESQKKIAGKIDRFAKKYRKNKIVVTSRTAGYHEELKGFTKVEVMEFDDRQIEKFIENWFGQRDPDRAKSMFSAIKENERITVLARNPLMISIIAIIYEEDRELPQRRADLYKRCVEVLLSKWDVQKRIRNKYTSEKKEFILRKLAFYGQNNNKRIMMEEEIVEEMLRHFPRIGLKESDAKPFLDEIWQRSYILKQISMNSYDFLHLSFQEYFTALELKEREDGISIIIQNLSKSWWEEPILLYAGISRDASTLIKRIEEKVPEDMFCSNLIMFGKCVGDAEFTDVSLKERIVNEIWDLYQNSEFRLLRERAIEILRLIKPDGIIEKLIRDLKDIKSKGRSRERTASALGRIGSDKVVEPLLEVLIKDDVAHVRGSAASALGRIGSDKVVEPLLEVLIKDDVVHVRGSAASALGRIGSDKVVEPLLEALIKDDDANVRGSAAYALGRIGSDKVVESLLETLVKDDDANVRGSAATALGRIGIDKVIEPLLDALRNDDKAIVREHSAYALIGIGSELVVESLLEVMAKDDNARVRGGAASTLGRVGSKKALVPLLNALVKDDNPFVRGRAARALRAASALGYQESEVVVKSLLEALTKDDDAYCRGSAAYALGYMGNEVVIEPLLEALAKDDDAQVRGSAAYALGYIGNEEALVELRKALEDKAKFGIYKVKDSAFEAIEKISRRTFVRVTY